MPNYGNVSKLLIKLMKNECKNSGLMVVCIMIQLFNNQWILNLIKKITRVDGGRFCGGNKNLLTINYWLDFMIYLCGVKSNTN